MNQQRPERGRLSRSSNENSQSSELARFGSIFNVLRLGQPRSVSALHIAARGLALFLGGFGLLNVVGDFWHPGFDANVWWLDLRRLGRLPLGSRLAAPPVGSPLGLLGTGIRVWLPPSLELLWLGLLWLGTLYLRRIRISLWRRIRMRLGHP